MHLPRLGARRARIIAFSGIGLLAVLLVTALLLLSFGWVYLRGPLETRLTAKLGRKVTIGSMKRVDHGFFDATLAIGDVHVAQPDWVGGGDFATIRRATLTLPVLPLLTGSVRPQALEMDGLRIHLIRRDGDHANWKGLSGGGKGGGGGPGLRHLAIRDGQVRFDDFKRDHFLTAALSADDAVFRVTGAGTLLGRPSTVALVGKGLLGKDKWPFKVAYRSPIANATLDGVADTPLDLGHFDATVTAWGDDLKCLDQLVEAGVPGTAPVRLTSTIRHDGRDWTIRAMDAAIGRSRVSGTMAILKQGDRTMLDGKIVSSGLDFDDLANAEGRARAAAKRAAAPGRRLPDTRIDLAKLARTDAHIQIDIRRLLFRQPSAFRSITGMLTLDHGTLIAAPLTVGLARGQIAGNVRVTQKGAATRLAIDLALTGSRIEAMATDASAFSGALRGRFLLDGPGDTIRAALGAADGRFAIVGSDGTLGRQVALMLGQDIGRGVFAKQGEVARLRCGVGSFVVRHGKAVPAPLLIDTSVARAEARGMIDLTNERIDLSLTGAPKQASALRLSGPIRVTGALFSPTVAAPQATSTKGILKSIGRIFSGNPQPLAADADCAGLAARALR